jgi:creatinine amidohydrolase
LTIFKMEEMTWRELDQLDRERTLFLLPLGPMEEHGPHLPLGTDPLAAEIMAERAAQLADQAVSSINIVLLPRLYAGYSEGAMHFCGTLSVGLTTLRNLVHDLCSSIARHGFTRILLVNHHMELAHIKVLLQAAEDTMKRHPVRIVEASSAIFFTDGVNGGVEKEAWGQEEIHADVRETSLMLYRYPELVKGGYQHLPPVRINIAEQLSQGHIYYEEMGAQEGYMGSPAQASSELGQRHLETGAGAIAQLVLKLIRNEDICQIGSRMKYVLKHYAK